MDTSSACYTKCPMILQLSTCSRTARKSQWNPVRLNRVSSTSLIFDEISSAGCFCSPASARCLTALNCNLNFPLQLMVGMFSLVMSDNLKLFERKIYSKKPLAVAAASRQGRLRNMFLYAGCSFDL